MSRKVISASAFFFILAFATLTYAGTITGAVTYEGKVPKFPEIKMDADPICVTHNANPVYPETLVLGEGNTLANVFVYVKSGLPHTTYPTPTEPFVVTQAGCHYSPHVFGVMVNQPVKILNPDGTLHNVHVVPKKNKEFNLAMPQFRKETTKSFDTPEMFFPFKCDVHPWMTAWVSVMEHPFFSTSAKDGKFSITDLPPGEYEVEAWHEKLGTDSKKVKISSADETVTLDFLFSRP